MFPAALESSTTTVGTVSQSPGFLDFRDSRFVMFQGSSVTRSVCPGRQVAERCQWVERTIGGPDSQAGRQAAERTRARWPRPPDGVSSGSPPRGPRVARNRVIVAMDRNRNAESQSQRKIVIASVAPARGSRSTWRYHILAAPTSRLRESWHFPPERSRALCPFVRRHGAGRRRSVPWLAPPPGVARPPLFSPASGSAPASATRAAPHRHLDERTALMSISPESI